MHNKNLCFLYALPYKDNEFLKISTLERVLEKVNFQ